MRSFVVALVCLSGSSASARSVFLNGVNIDSAREQSFENCQVRLDQYGNVYIVAPGYKVETTQGAQPQPAPTAAPGLTPTQRYWLVSDKSQSMTQYDVDVYINGKFVRRFLDMEKAVVLEVTKFLTTGPNKLLFRAVKEKDEERKSFSPTHFFRVIFGQGKENARSVMIERKLGEFTVTAQETEDKQEELVIDAG